MTFSFADFVEENNSTAGTSAFSLTGATADSRTFLAALGASSQQVIYTAQSGNQFEIGVGTFDGSSLITRAASSVLDGSAGAGVLVNFSTAPIVRLSPIAASAMGRHNFSATTSPGVGEDQADGYSEGSFWLNVTTGQMFQCASSTPGAAIWWPLAARSRLRLRSDRWYTMPMTGKGTNGPGANVATVVLVDLPYSLTIASLRADVTTVGGAGSQCNVAIYAEEGGRPGALLWQGTPLAADGSPGNRIWTPNLAVPPGPLFLALVTNGTAVFRAGALAVTGNVQYGDDSASAAQQILVMTRNIGGVTFPDPFGAPSYGDTNGSNRALVWLQPAS